MDYYWDIREARETDLPFIFSTWSSSYRYTSDMGTCPNSIFFPNFNKVMDHILGLPETSVMIACEKSVSEVIFGYMVHQKPDIIHYAYVKQAFCNFGIAKSLLNALGGAKYYSMKTDPIRPIVKKHPELIFNPFLLFKQGELSGTSS